MNGFGVQNKFSSGKNIQPLNSFNKDAKPGEIRLEKEKKDELMNKYQSRKAQEADTLTRQLKNDHSVMGRNLLEYQRAVSTTDPKASSYDVARKLLLEANQKHNKPVLGRCEREISLLNDHIF